MPAKPPPTKTKTRPGLGSVDALPKVTGVESDPLQTRAAEQRTRSRVRDTMRREDPDEPEGESRDQPSSPDSPDSHRQPAFKPEATTNTRPKGTPRPPVTVDKVGPAAVKLAQARRGPAPRVTATRSTIAKAPIDARAAFLLSLVDGQNTMDALVDISGMPAEEVESILARLARLGLISAS
jgi:hypothetical protein